MSSEVKICDVTLRDGLQALDRQAALPLELKVKLFEALARSGLTYVEVGSFVHPKVMPAMAVTPELLARIAPGGAEIGVLVPTMKYYERAKEAPNVTTVALLLSASESYSKINVRMSTAEAMDAAREVTRTALHDGYRVRAYLSYAFRDHGPENSPQATEPVVRLTGELIEAGCEMVAVSDTHGTALPGDVLRIVGALERSVGLERVGVHFHDRYGLGMVNCKTAWEAGVRIFDAAVGGIGGNKMVKGSVSNVATEELVYMLQAIGVKTGIDFDALIAAGRIVEDMIERLGKPPPQSKILLNGVDALPAGM